MASAPASANEAASIESHVYSFVEQQIRRPSSDLKAELDVVARYCGGFCPEKRMQVTLVDGMLGKQGYSVKNYLVTISYLSYQSGLGRYRTLPILVVRKTHYGKPSLELGAVLSFGSLESRLSP